MHHFFYSDVTEKFSLYQELVKGSMFKHKNILKGGLDDKLKQRFTGKLIPDNALKLASPEIKKEYEDAVINELDNILSDEEIEGFSNNFFQFLEQRDDLLKSYVNGRLKQEQQHNPGNLKRYIVTEVMNKKTSKISKSQVETPIYLENKKILEELDVNPSAFIPNLYKEDGSLQILNLSNLAVITDKHGNENFRMYARVKSSERELQKLVDSLTGVRSELPFDSIGTTEIFQQEDFYAGRDRIIKFNHVCGNGVYKIDFRGISAEYNKEEFDEIIKEGNLIAHKIKKNPRKKISNEEQKKLLKGIWMDHYPKDIALETIMMTPKFHEWYTGPIGHTSYFIKNRGEQRQKKHEDHICTNISMYLEQKFKQIYSSDRLKI